MGAWKDFWTRDTRHHHRDEKYAEDYKRITDAETGEVSWKYDGDIFFWALPPAGHRQRRLICGIAFAILLGLDLLLGFLRTDLALMPFVGGMYGLTQAALVFLAVKFIGLMTLGREINRMQLEKIILRSNTAGKICSICATAFALLSCVEYYLLKYILATPENRWYLAGSVVLALLSWSFFALLRYYSRKLICEDGTDYFLR